MPLELRPAEPAALVCAVLARPGEALSTACQRLQALFGPVAHATPTYPFSFSSYYQPEMGAGLVKQLVCFAERTDPAALAAAKQRTMAVEHELAVGTPGCRRRQANIDPGLVTVESLVLATTKYSGQRICIAPGLYAEVTLMYQRGQWTCLPWTYPDYRLPLVHDFLARIRAELLAARRQRARGA